MNIEQVVRKTISKYNLADKKEKIVIALSGGKDSTTTAFLLKKFRYNILALHLNLGLGKYSQKCQEAVEKFCRQQRIKLKIFDFEKKFGCRICYIRAGIQNKINISNCFICGILKKWLLNKLARELKADKIATGHNLDDESQTIIMNFLKGNLYLGVNSGPKVGVIEDEKFIQRIKPLFFIPENKVREFSIKNKLPVIYEKCPCAIESYRIRARKFLNNFPDKRKLQIVKNFLDILPLLQKKIKNQPVQYCKICQEPSRNEICKKCQLFSKIEVK